MSDCYHSNNDYNHFIHEFILFIKENIKKETEECLNKAVIRIKILKH